MADIREICKSLAAGRYTVTDHARKAMKDDGVTVDDVEAACANGNIIEDYPKAYPLPACLVLGMAGDGRPLHICLSTPPLVKIITVYVPAPDRWEADWKTRKRRP